MVVELNGTGIFNFIGLTFLNFVTVDWEQNFNEFIKQAVLNFKAVTKCFESYVLMYVGVPNAIKGFEFA